MENLNENEYENNFNCLMKLYNFQESMRKFQIDQNGTNDFYLINPKSLVNYDEYYKIKDLKSIFSNNPKNNLSIKTKTKRINIEKLPIIKEKHNDEFSNNEIKSIFKIKYRNKEINLPCYNKIIIVNEEIKKLMYNVSNFINEEIIFINDSIAISLKENILEIFKYDNIKRVWKPRFIIIFEDQVYKERAIKELKNEGINNYLYKKNMKGHIGHEVLYNNNKKKIGEIINVSDILKEIHKKEKERKKEEYLLNKQLNNKIIKENNNEDEDYNFDDLKEENKYNDFENNNNKNNSQILNEESNKENEISKEKSIASGYEGEFKGSKNIEGDAFEEKEEKKEIEELFENNNINSKEENIMNNEIKNNNNNEQEKEILNQLEEEKNNNIKEEEIKTEVNNDINHIEDELENKINSEQTKKSDEEKNTEKNINEEIHSNNQNEINKEKDLIPQENKEEYNEEFNQKNEEQKINNEVESNNKEKEIFKEEKENNISEKEELDKDKILKEELKSNTEEKSENKEENKSNEEKKSIKADEKQIIQEEEKNKEQTNLVEEEKVKMHESIRLEDEDENKKEEDKINEEIKKKEEQELKEEQKLKEEIAQNEEKEKEQEKNIIENIKKKLEENEFKNKQNEIQNDLINEEMQRKKIDEEIKKKLEEEEIQNQKKQEDINNQINEEEFIRKKIEEQNEKELLKEENLRKQLEEQNNKDLEEELEIKQIEEDLGINNPEEQKEKVSLNEKTNEENKYKNTQFIQSLSEDPKIGLNNIGATCYMNATIQCFSRTTELSNFFLNPENNFTQDKKLSYSYYNLISNLWHKQENNAVSYSPYDFKNIISEMNPLFQGIAANDSKDLILFVLQQLHEELKLRGEGDGAQSPTQEIANQMDRNAVLEEFNNSMKNNVSIISDLFFGMNEIVSDCLNCRQKGNPIVKYNFQIFNFIIFPLKEVSNYKKTKLEILNNELNNNNANTNDDSVSIYDCFEQFVQPAIMNGDNMMFCNKCQQLSITSYTTKIYSSPKILILILNRGKGNEFKVKINFEKIISIGKYVELNKEEELKYELYAVLTHLGTSDMSGHFIAFCYSIIDKIWYKFNDAFVDPVNDFQKEVHDFEEPYILFYRKMD